MPRDVNPPPRLKIFRWGKRVRGKKINSTRLLILWYNGPDKKKSVDFSEI
jgi:hypothetical protein